MYLLIVLKEIDNLKLRNTKNDKYQVVMASVRLCRPFVESHFSFARSLSPSFLSLRLIVFAMKILSKYLPLPPSGDELEEAIRKGPFVPWCILPFPFLSFSLFSDVISHFTLRLAYCRPNDRQWFIQQEKELLKYRLSQVLFPLSPSLSLFSFL